jgi:hypothetical protein
MPLRKTDFSAHFSVATQHPDATTATALLVSLFVLSAVASAFAAEPPENVLDAVADAERQCRVLGGKPNSDAVLSVRDVNGDGGEDWIPDYAKFTCEGDINPMCDEDGCTLQIYLWDGNVAWNLAFEESVQRYRFDKSGGKPMLFVTFPGDACGKPHARSCTAPYYLEWKAVRLR